MTPIGLTYTVTPATLIPPVGNVINGLCAGIVYTITGTDANGCTATTTVQVGTLNGPVIGVASTTDASCSPGCDGTATMTPIGLTYTVTPATLIPPVGNVINGLCAGIVYTITGTDANGCTATTTVQVGTLNGPVIGVASTTDASCSPGCDGTATMTPIGLTYTVTPATLIPPVGNVINGLCAGIVYTITGTDANGCTATTTVQVGTLNGPSISLVSTTNPTTFGGTNGQIVVSGSLGTPGYTYSINPNIGTQPTPGTFNGLSAIPPDTCYVVTVTDAALCTASTIVCLQQPGLLGISTLQTNVTCFGLCNGTITASAGGGVGPYNFQIGAGVPQPNPIFTGLCPGVYVITAIDANNATATTNVQITEPTALQLNPLFVTSPTCVPGCDGTINSTAVGGTSPYTYSIANMNIPCPISQTGPGVFDNVGIATYTVTAADANGCTVTSSVTVLPLSPPSVTYISKQDPTCFGANNGVIVVSGTGVNTPYTFNLIPANGNPPNSTGTFNAVSAGNYQVQITDAAGCTNTTVIPAIGQPSQITFNTPTIQHVACFGESTGSITATAFGGTGTIGYLLNNAVPSANGFFTGLPANTYTVTAIDANGCSVNTIVLVNQNPQMVVTDLTTTEPNCFGEANGTISINVTGGTPPIVYSLDGGAYQSSGLFNTVTGGTHQITFKDILGCTNSTTIFVTEPDPVSANISVFETTCIDSKDGKAIIEGFGGRGGYKYYITPGLHINKSGYFTGLEAGTYTLTVVDTSGCNYETIFTINLPSNPLTTSISKVDLACTGKGNEGQATVNVNGGTPPYNFMWTTSPPQITQTAISLYYGTYYVDVIDANGCYQKDTVTINEGPCCDIAFIPNAFSPNGDGNNDEFRVLTTAGVQLLQLEVRDRWGKRVWSTGDYRKGWNGEYEGRAMEMDTYYYVLRYRCTLDNKEYIKKGDLILVR
ncbi:MAG: gliding motility-associated C-terminal domain-containing protein [Chitinophagaceae bacterium]